MNASAIGTAVSVVSSPNPSELSVRGVCVDETQETLLLSAKDGHRRIRKSGRTFLCDGVTVPGDTLAGRVEDRIKR